MTRSPELCGQNKQGSSVKGRGFVLIAMETTQSAGGGAAAAQLPSADGRPPQPQTRGRRWVAGQVSLPPGGPGTGSGPGPVGAAAGTGGQSTLAVRTCQKYRAEIRAAAPTHAAKNSGCCWVAGAGAGVPHRQPGLLPCLLGGRAWDASISLAGQLRLRRGGALAHALRRGALRCDHGSAPGRSGFTQNRSRRQ